MIVKLQREQKQERNSDMGKEEFAAKRLTVLEEGIEAASKELEGIDTEETDKVKTMLEDTLTRSKLLREASKAKTKPLACRECGHRKVQIKRGQIYYVKCLHCKHGGPRAASAEMAIIYWNNPELAKEMGVVKLEEETGRSDITTAAPAKGKSAEEVLANVIKESESHKVATPAVTKEELEKEEEEDGNTM